MKGRLQSHNRQIPVRVVCLVLVALGLTTVDVTAADWPEHLTLHEKSRSPDGHYGIVVTTSSHVDDGATMLMPEEGEEFVDYFADVQTHQLLGKIKGFEYVEGENHAHLNVEWTPDSKLCIATYWERYGIASAVVLQPKGDGFTQTDIGLHIRKADGRLLSGDGRATRARARPQTLEERRPPLQSQRHDPGSLRRPRYMRFS